MEFIKVSSNQPVVNYVYSALKAHLGTGKKVLWLLSGGSAIDIQVKVAKLLGKEQLDSSSLTVSLIDERYGEPDHASCNWYQLGQAGFSLPGANLVPVLKGDDLQKTTADFAEFIETSLKNSSYKLGMLGIGPDGHTSGILPHSPGLDSQELVISYPAPDYGQRITTTAKAVLMLDEAVAYVAGEPKHIQLDNLRKDLPAADQPAQILKKLKKATIFNDYIGEQS